MSEETKSEGIKCSVHLSLETLMRYRDAGKMLDGNLRLGNFLINGGGAKHRKSLGLPGGNMFYRWLKRHGYPEGYQTL